MSTKLSLLALVAMGIVIAGCDAGDVSPEPPGIAATKAQMPPVVARAGVGADVDASPENAPLAIAARKSFGGRADAFALLPVEKRFDLDQTSARLISEGGGYVSWFTVPEENVEVPVVTETLPLWRLSGVVIGDGVAALLDMGGKVIDIRPGMKIPDTDWVVASIDAERAVLRREGNKLPKVFVVPLQGIAFGGGAGGGGKAGGAAGAGGDNGGAGAGGGKISGAGD